MLLNAIVLSRSSAIFYITPLWTWQFTFIFSYLWLSFGVAAKLRSTTYPCKNCPHCTLPQSSKRCSQIRRQRTRSWPDIRGFWSVWMIVSCQKNPEDDDLKGSADPEMKWEPRLQQSLKLRLKSHSSVFIVRQKKKCHSQIWYCHNTVIFVHHTNKQHVFLIVSTLPVSCHRNLKLTCHCPLLSLTAVIVGKT